MEAAAGFAAHGEALVFLGCFADLPDPRQRGKVIYPLGEVLLLCLLAVLAGAETFVDDHAPANFTNIKHMALTRSQLWSCQSGLCGPAVPHPRCMASPAGAWQRRERADRLHAESLVMMMTEC